jgi:hypothetical protein
LIPIFGVVEAQKGADLLRFLRIGGGDWSLLGGGLRIWELCGSFRDFGIWRLQAKKGRSIFGCALDCVVVILVATKLWCVRR